MTIEELISSSMQVSIWGIVKIFYLLGIGLYLAFAILIVRQISLMSSTVSATSSPVFKLLGYVHLLFAFGVFFLALIIL